MKAVCWNGTNDIRVESVPDPQILRPRDAIVRITTTAICGSDLHLYDGYIPTMESGDILGHEFMGEVVDVGPEVENLRVGDRVVVPFPIACGHCWYCKSNLWSQCDNSNPNAYMLEALYGYSGAGIFGYSHLYGGYAGGQAEFARVPFADVGPVKIPDGIDDEQVIFLSDILPTGWEAAARGEVRPGDVVAVWGCGPVGQFTIRSAFLMGADRVIAIDRFPIRLDLARQAGAETIEYDETDDLIEVLKETTGGRGPDVCIDAVGLEAHGTSIDAVADRLKQKVRLEMDRANVLRQVFQACGKGGRVSVIGVYAGFIDKFPFGAIFAKGITVRAGQSNVQAFMRPLLDRIQRGDIDPTAIITHRLPLEQAPKGYEIFRDKVDECVKVVLKPGTA
jgi:threonine dehydrogenase-like Zn-dependent dehydrogenase